MTETLANRRIFRSKLDTIRTTYGFEDVSLAPGHRHDRPRRRRPQPVVLRDRPRASRCSPRRWTPSPTCGSSGELARLGGLSILNLEGVQTRYDDPTEVLERIASAPDDAMADVLAEAYAAADPRGADRAPDRRAARRRLEGGGLRDARAWRAASGRSAPSTARTCSSSSRRSRRPATSRPATSRWRSRTSRGSCRSRWRSATRPTPRPPTC